MPFQWSSLSSPVLRGIAKALGLNPQQAAAQLQRKFGAVPDDAFIQDAWPVLRGEWLTRDRNSAKELAGALQQRGAGRSELPIRNHEQRLAYLGSCRVSRAVKETALPLFLAAGSSQQPAGSKAAPPPDAGRIPAPRASKPPAAPSPARSRQGGSAVDEVNKDEVLLRLLGVLAGVVAPDVPGMIAGTGVILAAALEGGSADVEAAGKAGMAIVAGLTNFERLVPSSLTRAAIERAGMPRRVLRTATTVADGCNYLATRQPSEFLLRTFNPLDVAAKAEGRVDFATVLLVMTMALHQAGSKEGEPDHAACMELVEWATDRLNADNTSGAPTQPAGAGPSRPDRQLRRDAHPLVASAVSAAGDDENVYPVPGGLQWWSSAAGGTLVTADNPVTSRGHEVTTIRIQTRTVPKRMPNRPQLAAALSNANVHGGIAAAVLDGDEIVYRSAMATHAGINGWVPSYLGVAMMASALTATHALPELKGKSISGPAGVRAVASPMVATFGGFEVTEEDQAHFVLPLKADIKAVLSALPGCNAQVKIAGEEVVAKLPGPNGKFEGWIGRKRSGSDDQELVVSKVTRPPWGAGVKFVLRVPADGSEKDNQQLAMRANAEEWKLVPQVNVWGGWSGEAGAIRLTAFIPQMLFQANPDANKNAIVNLAIGTIVRGNNIAVLLGLT